MQTIEVTDEQHAFVQRLREELSEQVVGKYGTVRERDAIQFLIDNFDGDLDVEADVDVDAGVDEVEPTDGEAITYEGDDGEESGTDDAESGAGAAGGSDGDGAALDPDDADEPDDGEDAESGTAGAGVAGGDDGTGGDDAGDAGGGGSAADDDDKLNRMMNLLETHDDKWEESPAADYRYRVTLPDGSTEDVQTKDDVRALLFKNY